MKKITIFFLFIILGCSLFIKYSFPYSNNNIKNEISEYETTINKLKKIPKDEVLNYFKNNKNVFSTKDLDDFRKMGLNTLKRKKEEEIIMVFTKDVLNIEEIIKKTKETNIKIFFLERIDNNLLIKGFFKKTI